MNEISRKPAHTVTELTSARQHQENPAEHHRARGGGKNERVLLVNLGFRLGWGFQATPIVVQGQHRVVYPGGVTKTPHVATAF